MNRGRILIVAIAIAIVVVSSAVYYLTLPSAQTAEKRKKLQIMSYTSYNETIHVENKSIEFLIVVGEVKNNLTTNVKSVIINVTFYDEKDNLVRTQHGHALLDLLEPNHISPFKIYSQLNLSAGAPARTKLAATCFETDEQSVTKIEILKQVNDVDEDGYRIVNGEVQNKGSTKVSAVKVLCAYHDADKKVIGVSSDYVSSKLNAGDKAKFKVSSKPHKYPASYTLFTTARYEPPFNMRYQLFLLLVAAFVIFVIFMRRRGW